MNFLTKLDRTRFTSLLDELAKDQSKGINTYPANRVEAMQLAHTYRSDGKIILFQASCARSLDIGRSNVHSSQKQ